MLLEALSHRSWCAEHGGKPSNERLEFLGDAVLELVVTEEIFTAFPEMAEGELAKLRASVVKAPALAELAIDMQIGPTVLLGRGEEASGGREKTSILADAVEACFGAVFVDGGWAAARAVILDELRPRIAIVVQGASMDDSKTFLQELVAHEFGAVPRYQVTESGPDHAKTFYAEVRVDGAVVGTGVGRSKKQAEQMAAQVACEAVHIPDVDRDHSGARSA